MASASKLSFICALLLTTGVFAQINDDFSDGEFSTNPTWSGDELLFTVENEILRSNSPGEAQYYLSTPNQLIVETQWEFFVNLDFATSGANYVDVYLVSQTEVLDNTTEGYFLRLGGTPDEISFYKRSGNTQSLLIDGEDGVIGSSGNNIFVFLITRSAEGLWTLNFDEGNTGSFTSGGSVTDNDFLATSYFGFRIVQSSAASAVNSHFFDDIKVGPIPIDETAPELLSAAAISENQVELFFNETLEESSAENEFNYGINNDLNIVSAVLDTDNPLRVTLSTDQPFQNGANYTVTVTGVQDLNQNSIDLAEASFQYFVPEIPAPGDVIFNEIFADPTPVVGLPDAEFIELFNRSDKFFDLNGWKLINTTTERLLPSAILAPGAYVILCNSADVESYQIFGNVVGIGSFTALSNGGDSLTLISPQDEILDIVSYTDAWYEDPDKAEGGYTLELINPDAPCSGRPNWSASNHPSGGTPGSINSIFSTAPDNEAPEIAFFALVAPDRLRLVFTEFMDPQSLENGFYEFSGGIEILALEVGDEQVELVLSQELEQGISYTLTLSGLADCSGNALTAATAIEILLGSQPGIYDIIISEIMADPSPSIGLPEGEYFELYNAANTAIEIQGMTLNDRLFASSRVVQPGEYLLVIDDAYTVDFLLYPDAYVMEELSTTFFTNSGLDLMLRNAEGDVIDFLDYRLSWYRDPAKEDGGYSLERINLNEPCRGSDNWTGSEASQGGTPGAVNSVASSQSDETPPQALLVLVKGPTELELVFNETLDSLSVLSADFDIAEGPEIITINNIAPDYTRLSISLDQAIDIGEIYELTITGIADCTGNTILEIQSLLFGFPEEAAPGEVIINEVLFNPNTGGSDFVEIVNVSDKVIGIQNWILENNSGTEQVIAEEALTIFPGRYLLLTSNADQTISDYPFGVRENFLELESLPSFNNGSGSVILKNNEGEIIDAFDYLEEYHFSLLNSFKGVSLERISFTLATNNRDNWTSASEKLGFATPGRVNSQYSPEGRASAGFELEDEVFSPDNDGFEDVLKINYNLGAPGFVANISIFDSRGRKLAYLERNTILPVEGTIIWDGVVDNGTKARIGPHIVYIELFDLDGNKEIFKLVCIVAGRLSN